MTLLLYRQPASDGLIDTFLQRATGLQCALSEFAPHYQDYSDVLASLMQRVVDAIIPLWRAVQRYLHFLRAHGNRDERHLAWKALHPPRRRRVKARRAR